MRKMVNYTIIILILFNSHSSNCDVLKNRKKEFEIKYRAWKESCRKNNISSVYGFNKEYYEIVKMGVSVIPFIIEKIKNNPEDFQLVTALMLITKKKFEPKDWPKGKIGDVKTEAKLFINWWDEGRKKTKEKFEKIYSDWKRLKKKYSSKKILLFNKETVFDDKEKRVYIKNNVTEFGKLYLKMKNFGIEILPIIISKIKNGDYDLLPLFGELTNKTGITNKGELSEKIKFTLNWWEKNKKNWIIPE